MTKPIVAVSCCWFGPDPGRTRYNGRPLLFVEQSMSDWLLRGGFLPVAVPFPTPSRDDVPFDPDEFLECVDALVLQGGVDVAPTNYGEQPMRDEWSGDAPRDHYEIALVESAMKLNKPILGICRGHQLINVALGGTLYQDIETQVSDPLQHRNADIYEKNFHSMTFTPGSWLEKLYEGRHTARINSVHHQAIKDLGEGLVVQGRSSDDDVIEAIKLDDDRFVVGVQWHPEFQDPNDSELLATEPLLKSLHKAIEKAPDWR